MTLLILGVVLWAVVHLMSSTVPAFRAQMIEKMGEMPYKGVFALMIILSLVLIVFGWRSTDPHALYSPPAWAGGVTMLLMINALVLLVVAQHPSRIKRLIRHPQLTGVAVWSIAHLISNGETRSLILFGGLGLWALWEMRIISMREGAWVKSEAPSLAIECRGLAIGVVLFVIVVILHPYFAGVSPIIY